MTTTAEKNFPAPSAPGIVRYSRAPVICREQVPKKFSAALRPDGSFLKVFLQKGAIFQFFMDSKKWRRFKKCVDFW